MTMILENFYASLARNPNYIPKTEVPHGLVYRTKWALEERMGRELSLEEVETAMRAEGLMPASEYGIPYWYRTKYLKGL